MNSPKEYEYDDVMVPRAMSPLYANLGSVSNGIDTRSYDEELVSLESLLLLLAMMLDIRMVA